MLTRGGHLRRESIPRRGYPGGATRGDASAAEVLRRGETVYNLLMVGADVGTIYRAMALEHGLTPGQVDPLLRELRLELQRRHDNARPTYKAEQLARLHREMTNCRNENRPNRFAIARLENLTAHIMGTLAPTRVEVDADIAFRDAVAVMVGNLNKEEREQMIEEQRELEARAALLGKGG